MTINSCTLNCGPSDQSKAQVIWDVFIYGYEMSVRHACRAECELSNHLEANRAFAERQKEEFGGGFDDRPPFCEADIAYHKYLVAQANKEVTEYKEMMKFVRDRFLEGFNVTNKGK